MVGQRAGGKSGSGRLLLGGGGSGGSSEDWSVYDALAEFFSEEDLGGDDCYRCERCKTLQRARKGLRVLSLPPILPLSVKRFRFGGIGRKAADRIHFPLEGLSLEYFARGG